MARAIVAKTLIGVLFFGPLLGVAYAAVSHWLTGEPWSESFLQGLVFALVMLVFRGIVGIWRMTHDPETFAKEGARDSLLRWLGLRRTAGRSGRSRS